MELAASSAASLARNRTQSLKCGDCSLGKKVARQEADAENPVEKRAERGLIARTRQNRPTAEKVR